MSQWYLSKNGQALGPLEEDKVIALIQTGDVSPVDLIYQAGASQWLPLSEVAHFSQYFKKFAKEPVPRGDEPQEWVLLKKEVSDKGREYKQIGPFSKEQVFELIDAGDIRFTDFCWKQGMETWVKISDLAEFNIPLPSSPKVDTSIYETTNHGEKVEEKTVVDTERKASLTELVNIEHYEHEKTVVQPMRASALEDSVGGAEDDDYDFEDDDKTELSIPRVNPIPLNEGSFVTESGVKLEESESDISLWSLEPPSSSKPKEDVSDEELDSLVQAEKALKKIQVSSKKTNLSKKPKPKPKRKREPKDFSNSFENVNPEFLQWVAAIGAVVVGAIFFYLSFQTQNTVVEYDKNSELGRQIEAQKAQAPKPFKREEISRSMEQYRKALHEARQKPSPYPRNEVAKTVPGIEKIVGDKKTMPVVEKIKPQIVKVAPAPPQPKVPLQDKIANGESVELVRTPAESNEKKVAKTAPKRSDRKKKQAYAEQVSHMKKSKKKTAAKEKVTVAKKIVKKKPATGIQRATGGAKTLSFFRQRDRMALFYTSLKGERLAVEIAREYKKLKGSKSAWNRYYGQWRKKVQSAMAKDIQSFPKKGEKYAYPKVLAEFKKDYNLFYKFGEGFNARVTGGRQPSGGPQDMKALFSRYKKQAQGLGR